MARLANLDVAFRRPPTLEELLDDDVTRAVMQADHVAAPEIRGLCRAVGSLLAQRSSGSPAA